MNPTSFLIFHQKIRKSVEIRTSDTSAPLKNLHLPQYLPQNFPETFLSIKLIKSIRREYISVISIGLTKMATHPPKF